MARRHSDADEPATLGPRGAALLAALHDGRAFDPGAEVLVVEACRIVDRLEGLNDVITGRGVLRLMHLRHMDDNDGDERHIVMTVDDVLSESRQQQLALAAIFQKLGLGKPAAAAAGGSALDDIAARRKARIAAASGL